MEHHVKLNTTYRVLQGNCLELLRGSSINGIDLSFVDPPFNQGKDYRYFDDKQNQEKYWNWLKEILDEIYKATVGEGAIYFMQREKNTEEVLRIIRDAGWTFQNLIIWKKKTSAVPSNFRFSKSVKIKDF